MKSKMKCDLLGTMITFDSNVVLGSRMKGKLKRLLKEKDQQELKGGISMVCSWVWSLFVGNTEDILSFDESPSFFRWMIATYYGAENFTLKNEEKWIEKWGIKRISDWELSPLSDSYSVLNEETGEYEDVYEDEFSDSDSESDMIDSNSDTESIVSSEDEESIASSEDEESVVSEDEESVVSEDEEYVSEDEESVSEDEESVSEDEAVVSEDEAVVSEDEESVVSGDEESVAPILEQCLQYSFDTNSFASILKHCLQYSFDTEITVTEHHKNMCALVKSEKIYSNLLSEMQTRLSSYALDSSIKTSLIVQCDSSVIKGLHPDYSDDQVELLIKILKRTISLIDNHNMLLENIEKILRSSEMSENDKVFQIEHLLHLH